MEFFLINEDDTDLYYQWLKCTPITFLLIRGIAGNLFFLGGGGYKFILGRNKIVIFILTSLLLHKRLYLA